MVAAMLEELMIAGITLTLLAQASFGRSDQNVKPVTDAAGSPGNIHASPSIDSLVYSIE